MTSTPAIGIDLGTTFSCISVYRKGNVELIANSDGDNLTPSIVYFHPKTGTAYVGQIADALLPNCPKNGITDVKRFMGRKYDDEFISRYTKSNEVHFTVVQAHDGQAAFEIDFGNKKVIKKPEEVSAEILKHLKQAATVYLGKAITKAVISVPAYFSNAQRKATKKAAELAGLTVLKLITEPTAAAIHYVSDKERKDSNILAFDFGGGTLDVSLIKVMQNVFEVKAVYGDTLLGGRNFDEVMFDHFYKDFADMKNENFASKKFKRRLSQMCVDLKKKLTATDEFTLFIDRYDGNSDISISMTRAKFEEIADDLFRRTMDIVELCLNDAGFTKTDINEVILVGGSTRMPKIQQLLTSYFGSTKIKTDLSPDFAVAAGASIHAALLLGDCKDMEKYKLTEVTPMSLGVSEFGGIMDFFLPKNSPLPACSSHNHVTCFNDQKAISFIIYEGERKNKIYNNKLGEITIENLPKRRAGDVEVAVCFDLDEDGILSVTATETSTGKSNKLVVTMGQFRLSERKIRLTIEDAKKHKQEDAVFEQFVRCKQKLQKQCRRVLYDINKISTESGIEVVKKCCNDFINASDDLSFTKIEELKAIFTTCKDSVADILRRNSMDQLVL